jgi:hypothetical protein
VLLRSHQGRRRILAELLKFGSSSTSDPGHLMRVFDITADTAMSYIYAAHPDKHPTRLE